MPKIKNHSFKSQERNQQLPKNSNKKCHLFGWTKNVLHIAKNIVTSHIGLFAIASVVTEAARGLILCQPLTSKIPLPLFSVTDTLGESTKKFAEKYVVYPIGKSQLFIKQFLPKRDFTINSLAYGRVNLSLAITQVAVEEIFTFALKEGLLRQAPKAFLAKVYPAAERHVDHPIARISRVAFVALIFAIIHTDVWEANHPTVGSLRLYDTLLSSLVFNSFVEFSDSKLAGFLKAMTLHFEENYPIFNTYKMQRSIQYTCIAARDRFGW